MRAPLLLFACLLFAAEVPAFEIEGVPFVKQQRLQCGPSALSSVLAYYGSSIGPEEISRSIYNEKLKGTLITDLENYARKQGFRTESGQGSIERVREWVGRQRPVIVLVDLGAWVSSRPHYLVVFGYDAGGFIVHDGETAARRYRYPRFREVWQRMGRAYLLVTP